MGEVSGRLEVFIDEDTWEKYQVMWRRGMNSEGEGGGDEMHQ